MVILLFVIYRNDYTISSAMTLTSIIYLGIDGGSSYHITIKCPQNTNEKEEEEE